MNNFVTSNREIIDLCLEDAFKCVDATDTETTDPGVRKPAISTWEYTGLQTEFMVINHTWAVCVLRFMFRSHAQAAKHRKKGQMMEIRFARGMAGGGQ